MEESILRNVKKVLGIAPDYTAFDTDVILQINMAFSTLNDLGVGPDDGFFITDDRPTWADFGAPDSQLNMVKAYIPAKARLGFDPPQNSFGLDALKAQITEFEWRLNFKREVALPDEEVV